MSRSRVSPMLAVELRILLRERLTWMIFAALLAVMLLAAWSGANRVAAERTAIAAAAALEARSVHEARAAHDRYGRPGPLRVAYWQDPTHAFGYMTYFLTTHAVKPPTPLAALAAGQSDVQPSLIRMNFGFSTVFDDTSYELGTASRLRLGPFDLAFVLIYLVPLAVIALGGTRLASEQDSGILRMIAAQPVGPRKVAAAKFGAVALVAVGGVLGTTATALLVAGDLAALGGWGTTLAWLAAGLAAYTILWVAACAVVAGLWRGAVAALAILVLAWACVVIALPAALGLAVDVLAPHPSRIAAIDASRQAQTQFYAGQEGARITAAWLAGRLPEAADHPGLPDAPEIKRLARDAFFDTALAGQRAAMQDQARAAARWSARFALLSPATTLALALQTAAGTDAGRHAAFLAAASRYRGQLRSFFEPRILAQARNPVTVCDGCQARLDFAAYDTVPVFVPVLSPARAERQALVSLAALLAGVLALTAFAYARLARWPT